MRYLFATYAFDTDRRELHRGADVASRTSTGFNSTPNDGATIWTPGELLDPGGNGRIPKKGR